MQFLGLCAREDWLEIPKKEPIYEEDLPKSKKLKQPRYIPSYVSKQLNQHLNTLPEHMERLLVILQECGMRIGEVSTMPFNCLIEGANKSFLLKFYLHKMKKEHIIPISDNLASVIKIQQQYVISQWGQGFPHLFPTSKPQGKGQPISYIFV